MSEVSEPGAGDELSAEQKAMRDQLENALKSVTVEEMVGQSCATILNVGARRAGLMPGSESERDSKQLALAIEAASGLITALDQAGSSSSREGANQLRGALSQLQLAYAQMQQQSAQTPPEGAPETAAESPSPPAAEQQQNPQDPGGTETSGRLWVPGR